MTFTGTVLNASGVELFLNGAGGGLSSSELTLDLTPFFTLTPLSLLDGESYTGDIFSVASAMWLFPTTILEHLPYKGEWIRGPSIPWGRQISRSRLQTLRQFQNRPRSFFSGLHVWSWLSLSIGYESAGLDHAGRRLRHEIDGLRHVYGGL